MSNLCIIPARGGSKRIPRKNIRSFLGSPIISYSIRAAIESGLFDDVMVSTDDDEIAQVAQEFGASIPFKRSKKASDDYATTADVLLEVLEAYWKKEKRSFENLCCLYPCSPLVTSATLRKAWETYEAKTGVYDALIPVMRFGFPPQRSFHLDGDKLAYHWPEHALSRSQDLEPLLHDAGQFYWIRTKVLQEMKTLVPAKTGAIILEELEVQDIDNEMDWKMAELKFSALHNG